MTCAGFRTGDRRRCSGALGRGGRFPELVPYLRGMLLCEISDLSQEKVHSDFEPSGTATELAFICHTVGDA